MALEAVIYHKRGQASSPQFRVETIETTVKLRSEGYVQINPDHTVIFDAALIDLETATDRVIDTKVSMPADDHHPNPWIAQWVYMPIQGDQISLIASGEEFDSRSPERITITAASHTPQYALL